MWFLGIQVLLLLGSQVPKTNAAPSVSATFSTAIQYQFDTDGNAIDLTSGRVDYLGSSYVWYALTFGRMGGALFFLFGNVSGRVTIETLSPLIFSSALETFLGSNNSKPLPEEVIANSPLTDRMRKVFLWNHFIFFLGSTDMAFQWVSVRPQCLKFRLRVQPPNLVTVDDLIHSRY